MRSSNICHTAYVACPPSKRSKAISRVAALIGEVAARSETVGQGTSLESKVAKYYHLNRVLCTVMEGFDAASRISPTSDLFTDILGVGVDHFGPHPIGQRSDRLHPGQIFCANHSYRHCLNSIALSVLSFYWSHQVEICLMRSITGLISGAHACFARMLHNQSTSSPVPFLQAFAELQDLCRAKSRIERILFSRPACPFMLGHLTCSTFSMRETDGRNGSVIQ